MDLLARDANDLISHDNIFRSVRSVLPKIWGETYPVAEILDDLENYRPLHLFHLCQAAKLELLRLARSTIQSEEHEDGLQKLWQHIENFGDVCEMKSLHDGSLLIAIRNSPIFSF